MRRGGVLLTLWLVVAGTAIATGTWALSLVGGEISDPTVRPLSGAAIDDQLQADRAGNDGPVPSSQATRPTALPDRASRHLLNTPGGSIVAECQKNDAVYLFSWVPAPGYRSDDDDEVRGPAFAARLTFKADKSAKVAEVTATVRCERGVAKLETVTDTDHHGGTPTGTPTGLAPSPTASDDHGGGGHGADDDTGDDHGRGGGSSGSGGGTSGGP